MRNTSPDSACILSLEQANLRAIQTRHRQSQLLDKSLIIPALKSAVRLQDSSNRIRCFSERKYLTRANSGPIYRLSARAYCGLGIHHLPSIERRICPSWSDRLPPFRSKVLGVCTVDGFVAMHSIYAIAHFSAFWHVCWLITFWTSAGWKHSVSDWGTRIGRNDWIKPKTCWLSTRMSGSERKRLKSARCHKAGLYEESGSREYNRITDGQGKKGHVEGTNIR